MEEWESGKVGKNFSRRFWEKGVGSCSFPNITFAQEDSGMMQTKV
jgi:hypothetical protein